MQGENDYSGNRFTGVSPHTIWTGLRTESTPGTYCDIHYNYTDDIPLNDVNTEYAKNYHLLMAKLEYSKGFGRGLLLDIYWGK